MIKRKRESAILGAWSPYTWHIFQNEVWVNAAAHPSSGNGANETALYGLAFPWQTTQTPLGHNAPHEFTLREAIKFSGSDYDDVYSAYLPQEPWQPVKVADKSRRY